MRITLHPTGAQRWVTGRPWQGGLGTAAAKSTAIKQQVPVQLEHMLSSRSLHGWMVLAGAFIWAWPLISIKLTFCFFYIATHRYTCMPQGAKQQLLQAHILHHCIVLSNSKAIASVPESIILVAAQKVFNNEMLSTK